MMTEIRLEKLKFIVDEMQIAFHLASNFREPFFARTIARHILVRAENFISHANLLLGELRAFNASANIDRQKIRKFQEHKNAYASNFDEYYKDARHRLGAHIQDFDFGKRIELWNDIEIVKTSYFVDGAKEIYQSLEQFNLSGYIVYADPSELNDINLLNILRQFESSSEFGNAVEMGADPLAMTRNNTVACLNMTPIHERAGQLALIRRWISIQINLIQRLSTLPNIVRILKARIITDIVSFCDCLVTRSVAENALQAMNGLDRLLIEDGHLSDTLINFVVVSKFQIELNTARNVRDKIGAHVENCDNHALRDLLVNLDDYNLGQSLEFFFRVNAIFNKICFELIFLRIYAADGRRLYGVSSTSEKAVSFTGHTLIDATRPLLVQSVDDEAAYLENFTQWIYGDASKAEEVRHFFWNAFLNSKEEERINEVEKFSFGHTTHSHEFRKAHQFFFLKLSSNLSDIEFKSAINLIISCRTGDPYPLAEILIKIAKNIPLDRRIYICYALGELGSAPHHSVSQFLSVQRQSEYSQIRIQAVIAEFKTYIKSEGVYRLNNRERTKSNYDDFTSSLLLSLSPHEKLICKLSFASVHFNYGSFSSPFELNYKALQDEIKTLCLPFIKDTTDNVKATMLSQLIRSNDYVGISLLVAIECGEHHPLYEVLLEYCCCGLVIALTHDKAQCNLAKCFYLRKDYVSAFNVLNNFALNNPELIEVKILSIEMLHEIQGTEDEVRLRIEKIRHDYMLTQDFEIRLKKIETSIAARNKSS
ncbi:hypothetical protein ACO0K7_16495 [Undibacterium sp. Ji67W]|uniref:hypothetical protein n=1 Tax=Undibacterium sp. Ji67W TaxID=3413042 RepID=UPI003BF28887